MPKPTKPTEHTAIAAAASAYQAYRANHSIIRPITYGTFIVLLQAYYYMMREEQDYFTSNALCLSGLSYTDHIVAKHIKVLLNRGFLFRRAKRFDGGIEYQLTVKAKQVIDLYSRTLIKLLKSK